ncbi:hypothetical protein MMC19_006308 [Ptychographa xylographoides]|nr:hypothetical protein [Ptychographa xylographoides]
MQFIKISAAAVLAFASFAHASKAIVKNGCPFDVYLWSVGSTSGEMQTLPAGTGNYSEAYQTRADGGGISLKLSTDSDAETSITQFEYTLEPNMLWYDVSNVNGYPFADQGLELKPSHADCRPVVCTAGVTCTEAYNQPDDNFATAACGPKADLTMTLCPSAPSASKRESAAAFVAHRHARQFTHSHARRARRGQVGSRV